jgi:hypothetical protein
MMNYSSACGNSLRIVNSAHADQDDQTWTDLRSVGDPKEAENRA